MARYLVRSSGKPRETKLIQRATMHSIAGDVENITRVRGFVNTRKGFIENTYFDKLNLRWYRSITLFEEPIVTPQVGPSQTANTWHTLNNSQRYLKPQRSQTTFISSAVHQPLPQLRGTDHQSRTPLFRAG